MFISGNILWYFLWAIPKLVLRDFAPWSVLPLKIFTWIRSVVHPSKKMNFWKISPAQTISILIWYDFARSIRHGIPNGNTNIFGKGEKIKNQKCSAQYRNHAKILKLMMCVNFFVRWPLFYNFLLLKFRGFLTPSWEGRNNGNFAY